MKFKFLFTVLFCLFFVPSFANENISIDSLIQVFNENKGKAHIETANQLMEQFESVSDTLYIFNDESNIDVVDFETYRWGGEYYYAQSKYNEALDCSLKALQTVECDEIEDGNKSDGFGLAAIIYTRVGDFTNAISYAEKALAIDKANGDKDRMSSNLNTIAGIYLVANQHEKAVSHILESIEIEELLDRPNKLAIRYGMASEIYSGIHDGEKAKEMAQKALDIEKSLGNPNKIAIRQSQLAGAYLELKDTLTAEKFLIEASDGLRKVGNLNSLAITLNQLGNIVANRGEKQNASELFKECAEICEKTGNKLVESKARKMAYQNLRNINDKEALVQLERYSELLKDLYNEQTAESLAEFEAKYETAEKQHQIELKEEQIKRQRINTIFLIWILVAAIVGLVLALRLIYLRNRSNKILVRTNILKDKLIALGEVKNDNAGTEEGQQEIADVAKEISSLGALPDIHLTNREKQVIALSAQGLMTKEIADKMNISQRTVDTHKTNIFKKLGINSTVELIIYAKQAGII